MWSSGAALGASGAAAPVSHLVLHMTRRRASAAASRNTIIMEKGLLGGCGVEGWLGRGKGGLNARLSFKRCPPYWSHTGER